jgi:hypothetical protein
MLETLPQDAISRQTANQSKTAALLGILPVLDCQWRARFWLVEPSRLNGKADRLSQQEDSQFARLHVALRLRC